MFSNRTKTGRANIVGYNIRRLRKSLKISQRELADNLQNIGMKVDKNAIQRMESGRRFITDIDMFYIAKVFNVSIFDLYKTDDIPDEIILDLGNNG